IMVFVHLCWPSNGAGIAPRRISLAGGGRRPPVMSSFTTAPVPLPLRRACSSHESKKSVPFSRNVPVMSTFTGQIDRGLATRFGHETVAIGEHGEYRTDAGVTVDIKAILSVAVAGTLSYPPDLPFAEWGPGPHDTRIEVANETTLSAGKRLIEAGCSPVLLNFASAKSPGGGFLNGALAQEEYLARSSCLYQCIRSNPMYAFHRANNDPLYTDYAIYSPGVPVIRDDNVAL